MNSQENNTPGNPQLHDYSADRPDISSLHVREDVARAGHCGNVHLPTGRICAQPERHAGSCEFVDPGAAENIPVQ